jgi:putative transposase
MEAGLKTQDYEISVDPDDPDETTKPDALPKKRATTKAKVGDDSDPTMIAAASRAGGHPMAEQELPGAEMMAQERHSAEDLEDEAELERARKFRKDSSPDAEADGVTPVAGEEVPLAPTGVTSAATDKSNAEVVSLREYRKTRDARAKTTGLVDENDDDNWS